MKLHQVTAAILTTAIFMLGGSVALAHNAGHIHLPTGECRTVGGENHAHNPEQDRDPDEPGDQFGSRHAADQNARIFPRACDDPRVNHETEQ